MFQFPHDHRPNQVLLHDDDFVMYDVWWLHLDRWGLAGLDAIKRQHIRYYVTIVSTLLEKATHLRSDPLSADELKASAIYLLPLRPDGGTKAGVRATADNGSCFTAGNCSAKPRPPRLSTSVMRFRRQEWGSIGPDCSEASQRSTSGEL